MNWGWKMAAVYIGFVGFMLTFVFTARNEKIELVTKDYYAEEIKFKERMDAMRNAQELPEKPVIDISGSDLVITYPASFQATEGSVKLYCPHDAASDQLLPMEASSGSPQVIPGHTLNHGRYNVALQWKSGDKTYYHEKAVSIP